MDLFGPVNIMSINKKKYCFVIVYDFTRFSWTFFLHSKDEASQLIINHIKAVDNGIKWTIKKIRSANGTEFSNSKTCAMRKELLIHFQLLELFNRMG